MSAKRDRKEIERILYQYGNIPSDIQKLNKQLNDIITNKEYTYNTLQAAKCTGEGHGTDISDQTYTAVEKLIDTFKERIDDIVYQINQLILLQKQIDDIFHSPDLNMEERRIINLRYFNYYSWQRIPATMKYSRSQCFRVYGSAIDKIERMYFEAIRKTA